MTILFTICARAGSKGVKNKNLRSFLGYPLSFYTASAIDLFIKKNNNKYICDIILNTDSKHLITLFENNINMPIKIIQRDCNLSLDDTPKINVIQNIILDKYYDIIIDLDITSPLRTVEDIEALIQKKIISNADVVFSVTNSRRNPYFNMVVKTDDCYKRVISSNFDTRQQAPEVFDMNASMYAFSSSFIASKKNIFEGKCDVIKMIDTAVLDIDTEEDLELMQVIAKYFFDTNYKMNEIKDNIKNILRSNVF